MKTISHQAASRGYANHGWLEAKHSFSFASYYDPERINFGALRVLNDDKVSGGMGFNKHPHDNMEIITIPLEGGITHKDSMGNGATIQAGEIQVMSAGKGIFHSEMNANHHQDLKLLQIWLFPKLRDVEPRYQQISLDQDKMKNNFLQVLSPKQEDEGVWIHQDAWFHLGEFEPEQKPSYQMKNKNNGLYIFLIKGNMEVNGQNLDEKDAVGLWDFTTEDSDKVQFNIKADSKILLMEVPMHI